MPGRVVVERAVAVVGHQTQRAGRVDAEHGQYVAGVRVGVVGQDIAGRKAGVFVGGEAGPASSLAVGPSFLPLIVMVTVAVSVPPLPSLRV